MYYFKWVRGEHIEVFLNGEFIFSADNTAEAERELLLFSSATTSA